MQKKTEDIVVDISPTEFWFLLNQFSPAILLGIENPYFGWLAEEIEPARREALRSLVDRDLVRMVSPEEIALEESLAAMVAVCAQAESSLIIQSQESNGVDARRYIHFGGGLIVQQRQVEDGNYQLTAIQNVQVLSEHLNDDLRTDSKSASKGKPFQIPEGTLFGSNKFIQEGKEEAALNLLKSTGLANDVIERLCPALSAPVANTSFALLANRNNPDAQYVSGFAVLEGQDEMWLMQVHEQNGKPIVTFNPANANMVLEHFLEIMPAGYGARLLIA